MTPSVPPAGREERTIAAMIGIYCHAQHVDRPTPGALCGDCQALQDYAYARLDRCPFRPHKPTCANCTVHCYRPDMRQRVREVMRYAGPRMLLRHPLLAIAHLVDGLRRPPQR